MLAARGSPGDREQALALLDRALATARKLGMARLTEQALALADRITATLQPAPPGSGPRPAYPAGLTAREVEVLRLLAGGRTNKQIAAALVVSVRTVENHIAGIYGKIGAGGRADAATYALRHGLS
jgi:DNA-binding NarL/FixJ family response regulator